MATQNGEEKQENKEDQTQNKEKSSILEQVLAFMVAIVSVALAFFVYNIFVYKWGYHWILGGTAALMAVGVLILLFVILMEVIKNPSTIKDIIHVIEFIIGIIFIILMFAVVVIVGMKLLGD